jgi:two-component system response regulator RegA
MPGATFTEKSLDRSLLIVDDDKPFLQRFARAMENRGFDVKTAESVAEGLSQVASSPPALPWSICGSPTAAASR